VPADDHLREPIRAERLALVVRLRGLPAAAWETPTRCSDWTVRQVAYGSGAGEVRGASLHLAMAVLGRTPAYEQLTGAGVGTLADRTS
jgi:hypothetical protein